jgi:tetratricopeptide (TPR) repeat protein
MKEFVVGLLMIGALAGAAKAADKPVIGPAPPWVRPVAWPASIGETGEAPVRILLSDQQIAFEPGRETVYSEIAFKIQTPQGLAAGSISLPWRPDIDVLTVHKLVIHRGDKTIDVLADGQTFTVVRREQNLDNAVLDGVLTANIQPEGLQVGDVVDMATSITSSDPSLKGHLEELAGAWNGISIDRAHLRIQWPSKMPIHVRQAGRAPALKPVQSGAVTVAELSLDHLAPITPPKGAPPRYSVARLVEITDFNSWADLGALMAPLYNKAAAIPAQGPLRTELDRIISLSPDPKVRTQAALTLVQDRVRYVALAMGTGGYIPADAETTWSRRFGDCKGKTALLLALLHAMGIEAQPVIVSTVLGDGMDARLPLVELFNHVLVRATIAGKPYWLDGTRTGDTSLERLTTPAYGWGLPLAAEHAALVRLMPAPLDIPNHDVSIRIDASTGIAAPAPAEVQLILRGDEALTTQASLANLAGEQRDQALKSFWKGQYDFIDPKTVSASFDAKMGELTLTMSGSAKLDWANGNYQTDGSDVGYRADFSRDPGPDADAPFAVPYPYFNRTRETILLPKGLERIKLGAGIEVDQTAGGIAYKRHATVTANAFSIETTARSVMSEFPAKNAAAEQAALRMLADRSATLTMPSNYIYNSKDLAAVRAETPRTSDEYVSRASIFANHDLPEEALRDYDRAIELDPQNVYAWANRSVTRIDAGDLVGARSDLNKAETLDPNFAQNFIARGKLADFEHRPKDAVAAYTVALQREPDNIYAICQRAAAYGRLGEVDKALADLAAAMQKRGDDPSIYIARGNFFMDRGRYDEAIADFDRAATLSPDSEWALADRALAHALKQQTDLAASDIDVAAKINPKNAVVFRARGLLAQQTGDFKAAVAAYTTSLEIDPTNTFTLAQRANANWSAGHIDAALQDAATAIKLDPSFVDLYLLRANIYLNQGKPEEALNEAVAVEAAAPDSTLGHVIAGNLYSAQHKEAEAMKAYDRALAIKPEAYIYVNRAQHRAKTDKAGRLADLDAALILDPKFAAALRIKADFQVEDGDFKGAATTYSLALAGAPDDPVLLTGRGIAYSHIGEPARAADDFAAATAKATKPVVLNTICWSKATAGVALQSALADCDAAVARAPDRDLPNYLDSRALVFLRLGRIDDAIADYDRALAKSPRLSSSLYGRAVAWARKGETAKSRADAETALRINPDIRAAFDRYGVTL